MRKTILMMLVVMVPIVTMAQKRSKKGSKATMAVGPRAGLN